MAMVAVLIVMRLMAMLAAHSCICSAKAEEWDWIGRLQEMDGSEFKDSIYPIIQMAANAYRFPSSIPIPGWSPASLVPPMAPPGGGAYALAYYKPDNNIIIAFRGTQLNDKQDGLADRCADMLLWEGLDFESLPPQCSIFTYSTLDYFSQALNFTHRVIEAYPGYPILLTGHSLGAGLAILVSAAIWESSSTVIPVIGFGAPGTKEPLEKRSLSLRAADEGKVFVIANEWDEITRSQWAGQLGILCLYHTVEPQACAACFSNGSSNSPLFLDIHREDTAVKEGPGNIMLSVDDCMTCFMETHVLKRLIALVQQGDKPICEQRVEASGLLYLDSDWQINAGTV